MPKPKPTQVIRHEIIFGRSERDLLEPALWSYTARNLSKSWYNITSDMTTVVVSVILYEYITGKDTGILSLIGDTTGSVWGWMVDGWNAYRDSDEYRTEYYERAGSPVGGLHNLWDNIISALSGADLERWRESENYPG